MNRIFAWFVIPAHAGIHILGFLDSGMRRNDEAVKLRNAEAIKCLAGQSNLDKLINLVQVPTTLGREWQALARAAGTGWRAGSGRSILYH